MRGVHGSTHIKQSSNREGDQDDKAEQESQRAGNAGADGRIRQPDSIHERRWN